MNFIQRLNRPIVITYEGYLKMLEAENEPIDEEEIKQFKKKVKESLKNG